MAKVIKYGDTTGIESDFEQAPVGLYHLLVEEVNQRESKSKEDMVEVVLRPVKDANGKKLKKKYSRLWYYAPLDPEASWARRLKELIVAFGLKSKNGNLATIEGKTCLGRLREDTDLNGEYRPNIGKLMKLPDDVEEDEPDEPDEAEDEDGDDLDEMSRAELKAYIKENGLEVKVLKSMSDEDIVAAIQEQMEDEDEEEDEDDDDEEEEDDDEEDEAEDEDNYEEMTIKELRQELEDRELETKGARKVMIARLRTDDQAEPV